MNIEISEITQGYINALKDNYQSYDDELDCDVVKLDNIPEEKLSKLAMLIMRDNKMLAYESMGADNNLYDAMHSAFLDYMGDVENTDKRNDFAEVWRFTVVDYLKQRMYQLLND